MRGRMLFSPIDMNREFSDGLRRLAWSERRSTFWVTDDEKILRGVYALTESEQRRAIEEAGLTPIMSYNQTDFVKDRVAVEVQFGKYAFVAHDLFVKHLSFYVSDIIDVGIEILPMKELEREMSSGVPYYERDLLNVLCQGRAPQRFRSCSSVLHLDGPSEWSPNSILACKRAAALTHFARCGTCHFQTSSLCTTSAVCRSSTRRN